MLDIIKNYRNDIERDEYLKEISDTLGIQIDTIYKMYRNMRTPVKKQEKNERASGFRAEDMLIALLLENPDVLGQVRDMIGYTKYVSPELQEILKNGTGVIHSFPLEKRSMYQAISLYEDALQIHANTFQASHMHANLLKLISVINAESFQKASIFLQQKVKSGDKEALNEYMKILSQKKLDK